ncbi:lateral signaling target protein 2 homolog [Drosophila takahashii]|uniref:lateral signaling target protein 2 homolog n=1 Tax=Drosophila takahashii TaxID=29030 RepID=UPI001CF88B40|nr:LOW QUALITY PROTEIN: lateral signaling target protein 2 homolog [Drosophila takahashii]
MRMVRPNRRKGIEEVYGSKMDSLHPVKSVAISHAGMTKTTTVRGAAGPNGGAGGGTISSRQTDGRTQRSFVTENDYYITTNLPLTAANLRNAPSAMTQASPSQMIPGHPQPSPYNAMSSRRNQMANKASARQPTKTAHFGQGEGKINNYSVAKSKEAYRMQHQHHGKANNTQRGNYPMDDNAEFSDKELMAPQPQQANLGNLRRHNQHSHAHQMQMQMQSGIMQHPPQHQLHQQQMSNHSQLKHHQQQQPHSHPHPHPHPHPHQKHSRGRQPIPTSKVHVSTADDDEKEDDPEEFFELIRQTVQTAVGNTISDALVKNFRDLSHKIERFSGELKQTNENLDKLQEQVTSKVIYYGEENSRHFRYLCMKSEYDKMFYQHQSLMTGKPSPEMINLSKANLVAAASAGKSLGFKPSQSLKHQGGKSHKNHTKVSSSQKKEMNESLKNSGAYHSASKAQQPIVAARKSSSDQSLVGKSSDFGVREVLDHIQRYCTQVQMKEMNGHVSVDGQLPNLEDILMPKKMSSGGLSEPGAKSSRKIAGCQGDKKDDDTEVETPVDSMDETYTEVDDFQFSSEISSCSEDDDCGLKYPSGAATARPSAKSNRRPVNKGAGDGQ